MLMCSEYTEHKLWQRHMLMCSEYTEHKLWQRDMLMCSEYMEHRLWQRHMLMCSEYTEHKLWRDMLMCSEYIEHKLWQRRDSVSSRLQFSGNTYTHTCVYRGKNCLEASLQKKSKVRLPTCWGQPSFNPGGRQQSRKGRRETPCGDTPPTGETE